MRAPSLPPPRAAGGATGHRQVPCSGKTAPRCRGHRLRHRGGRGRRCVRQTPRCRGRKRMLRALSGKTHQVHTGVCIAKGDRAEHFVDSCKVTFFPLGEEEIAFYAATPEPTIRPVPMPFRGARPCGWTASRATITPLWGCRSAAPYRRWRIFCEKNGKMIENLPKRLRNGALAAIIEPCYSAQEGLFAAGRPAFWDRFKERS